MGMVSEVSLKVSIKDQEGVYARGNVLIVEHNGKIMFEENDAGEPEDNSFFRDYAWVKEAIETAYELGKKDGLDAALEDTDPFWARDLGGEG